MRSYEKEVRFYQQLAPDLPIRTPAVYHADIDVATASFVLLLEDMAPAVQGDQLAGCTPDVAEVAVESSSGSTLLDGAMTASPRSIGSTGDPRRAAERCCSSCCRRSGTGFASATATTCEPSVHQAGDVLFSHLDAYLSAEPTAPTIVHGDYRLDNLLFDSTAGGTAVTVVDWQTVRHRSRRSRRGVLHRCGTARGRPAERGGGPRPRLPRAARRGGCARLRAGSTAGTSTDSGTWAGLVMAVAASMLVERTDRGDQMFLAMASRHARHALDLDAPALLV